MTRSPIVRLLLISAAFAASLALAGCDTDSLPVNDRASRPLSPKMIAEFERLNMDKESAILIRTFKEEAELEVWKQDRTGHFALLKTYPICRWSGELGPKIREGDRQAPEGFYTISPGQMNPRSQYYLSFDLGYPNAFDRAHNRTGANLMIHGDCSSRGCYSMTDEQVSEIYGLGREAFFGGQRSFQVQAYPFRMTPQNLAKHRGNPNMAFWKMLKQGNDHFEVTRLEPKVNVCEKRYVFNAETPGDSSRRPSFSASAKCPVFEVPQDILAAVQEKQRNDDRQVATLIARGTPAAPVRMNIDGGMHPVFVEAVKRNQVGVPPTPFSLASAPGTIPATVRPPQIPELADAPIMTTGTTPAPVPTTDTPAPTSYQAPPQVASADSTQPIARPPGNNANLFGSLFTPASKPANDTGPLDRMRSFMGLPGSEPAAKPAEAAVPTPKPKAKPVRQANTAPNGAIRPKPVATTAVATTPVVATNNTPAAATPAPAAWPAAAPAPAAKPAQPANTVMTGAQPVVPSQNFENRWSGFR